MSEPGALVLENGEPIVASVDSRPLVSCGHDGDSFLQPAPCEPEGDDVHGSMDGAPLRAEALEDDPEPDFTSPSRAPLEAVAALEGLAPARLKEMLQYSEEHGQSLRRGTLWLLPEEAEELNAALRRSGDQWHFKDVPGEVHPPIEKPKKEKGRAGVSRKAKRHRASGAGVPSGMGPPAKKAAVGTEPRHPSGGAALVTKDRSMRDRESFAQRVSRVSQAQLKRLPDWAQRLHHVLMLLCQTETFKPFFPEISIISPKYREVYDAIQPGLSPIGLWTIISKLEQNGYQSALDVFNDIYGVWLASYRTHAPGTPLWMQAFQASRTFLQQIANQPLRDDFTATVVAVSPASSIPEEKDRGRAAAAGSGANSRRTRRQSRPSTTPATTARPSTANVDELFQEFLRDGMTGAGPRRAEPSGVAVAQQQPGAERATTAAKRLPSRVSGKRKSKGRVAAADHPPITEAERELFQSYLSQLEAKHHLMLFETFRRTAVWRAIESGEVELDDTKTSPPVFRKMVAWCRAQLAVEQPLEKRMKAETESAAAPAVGSGKSVPTMMEPGKGKLDAHTYIQSRYDAAFTQPSRNRSSSSVSSSGSSATSISSSPATSEDELSSAESSDLEDQQPHPTGAPAPSSVPRQPGNV